MRLRSWPGPRWFLVVTLAVAGAGLPGAAASDGFSSVEPTRILAGSFYSGATLHVRGYVAERSQVAIRLTGPLEHHVFNRRGKIAGFIWGGIEHVTFQHAPSLYAVYSSAALAALAGPALRDRLHLGYETLESRMDVAGTSVGKQAMIEQFVLLKEKEGLYRVAPGAVHLGDSDGGRRAFDVAVPLPSTAAPGDIEVAVFELADGAVLRQDGSRVKLQRVGMPAFLFGLAHEQSLLFGLLAVVTLFATGIGVDLLSARRGARGPHPAAVVLGGLAQVVEEAAALRAPLQSREEIARMYGKYAHFRALLALNNELLALLAELEEESSWSSFRHPRVRMGIRALFDGTTDLVAELNKLAGDRYFDLANVVSTLRADVWKFLEKAAEPDDSRLTFQMTEIGSRNAGMVGAKTVNLARIEYDLGLRIPASFAVTIEAYREFVEAAGLAGQLRTVLAPARLDQPDDFRRRCELAQDLVRQAQVPPAVVEGIAAACRAAGFEPGEGLAVRSSAAGEGGELSFAGQFETVLNVPAQGVVEAWKKVVVSRFAPGAVFYRRAAGLAEVDTPMAVLVQRMVPARAAGVLFTRRPGEPKGSVLLVTAAQGLGPGVSAGTAAADELVLSRSKPHPVLERTTARKPTRLVGAEGGGLARLEVGGEEQDRPAITDDEASRLALAALAIEHYFGAAQDVEWVLDADGHLFIVQARPLHTEKVKAGFGDAPRGTPLLRGGEPIWPGRAVGPVHVARTPEEEDGTPTGALLVVPHLLPDCVRLLPRVCGIVVERGTVTGHAASILREFRVPSLFGLAGAVEKLVPGQEVSLDVASRSVFAGALWPELRGTLPVALRDGRTMGLPELLAGKLTKLSSSGLVGTWACQSLHDVIRFAHEAAIQAMFHLGDRLLDSPIGGVKKLDVPPPVYTHIVDLGGGLVPEAAAKKGVKPAEIVSAPFRAFWRGLGNPHFQPQRPQRPGQFLSVLTTTIVDPEMRELGSPNYACITDTYLNLNSRQAYHFVVVDSFLSENQNNNHISFRLKGGGAAGWQRNLRAQFAAEVLRLHHFTVSVADDLLNGWVRGLDATTGADRLEMIGYLVRFLARLDMWMTEASHVRYFVEAFSAAEAAARAARTAEQPVARA